MSRKPTKKKKEPKVLNRPYVFQIGRVRHGQYVYRYDTEAKAKAAMRRTIEKLKPDLERWNKAGLEVLDELRADVESAIFERQPTSICRVIDDHTGQDVYIELWKESA
jgi:hypothetical protein